MNPKLDYVEIEVGSTTCPACGEELDSVFQSADTALVGLTFGIKVFSAENEEHASRIAKLMVGKALGNVPLQVVDVSEVV